MTVPSAGPWTDEEYGFLADHADWPARRVAEALGRSTQAVYNKRWRIAHGWEPLQEHWSLDEDEVIVRAGPFATVVQIAERLPGRTEEAIETRRRRLGVASVNSNHKRPDVIGGRPLLAKSCSRCGQLLAARWYVWIPQTRLWSSDCKRCRSKAGGARARSKPFTAGGRASARKSFDRQQTLTVEHARRTREPYLATDDDVLADPDLTIFQKALRLSRTYVGVRNACARRGYPSHRGLGRQTDVWVIDNPNQPPQEIAS